MLSPKAQAPNLVLAWVVGQASLLPIWDLLQDEDPLHQDSSPGACLRQVTDEMGTTVAGPRCHRMTTLKPLCKP